MNREVLYAINLTQTQYDQLPQTAEVRRMVVLCVERRAEYLAQPEAMNGGMNAFDRFPDYHAAVKNLAALVR